MSVSTTDFACLVSEFLTEYLPLQRNYSKNTVLRYKRYQTDGLHNEAI